jgi:hypothetical protein
MVMTRLLPHWARGGTACVSDTVVVKWDECVAYCKRKYGVIIVPEQYKVITTDNLAQLHEHTPPGTEECPVLLVVDEAQDAFNARDWSDKNKRPFFSWLCQSRHDDNDVMIISQAAANVDKQIRRLCTFMWVTRNSEKFPFLGMKLAGFIQFCTLGINDGRYFIWSQLDQDGKTALARVWHRADKGIFNTYKSKSMAGAHKRAGEAVARLKLAAAKEGRRYSSMIKYALIAVVLCGCFAGYRAYAGNKGLKAPSQQVGASSSAATQVKASTAPSPAAPAYEIVAVTYRGNYGAVLATDEMGNLYAGQMCSRGLVERIEKRVARVRTPAGSLLYVVAEKTLGANVPQAKGQ